MDVPLIEVERKAWDYILYEREEQLILSVVVGSVALYEVNVALNAQETAAYRSHGIQALLPLVEEIRGQSNRLHPRHIRL